MRREMKNKWGVKMRDKKNREMRRKTKSKWGVKMRDKKKGEMRHKTKQIKRQDARQKNGVTRRE